MRASRPPYRRWIARLRPVPARAAGHLVELDVVEGQMVEHDVADVRDVDTLAERAGRDDHGHLAGAKRTLDGMSR